MRKYYLHQSTSGYWVARILDPVTGKILSSKSTHTKDKLEAAVLANQWVKTGVPTAHSNSRRFNQTDDADCIGVTELSALVNRLSCESLTVLAELVADRIECVKSSQQVEPVEYSAGTAASKITFPHRFMKRLYAIAVDEGALPVSMPAKQKEVPVVATVVPDVQIVDEAVVVPENLLSSRERMKADRKNGPMHGGDMLHRTIMNGSIPNEGRLPDRMVKAAYGDGSDIKVIPYMREFWDFDNSRWVKEQEALGHQVTRNYCKGERGIVDRYWAPYFGEGTTADQLDREILQEFFFFLSIECELSGTTVNHAITCGSAVFKYLYQKKLIKSNPFEGVRRFKKTDKKRSIPTETEVHKLLHTKWCNEPSYLAFYLGAFCGLRVGEISGLRMCDIDEECLLINVRHSWSRADGLKTTKNSLERVVPCDGETIQRLLDYARQNPDVGEMSYVFWSPAEAGQPLWPDYYRDGFYEAMRNIGISEEQRRDRNIVFHSLRHFCATILSKRGDIATVQAILGHKTADMTRHYSNHESEEKQRAMREALENSREYIFNFEQTA